MHLEGRARLHLGAATDWLPRWLAVLFPFSIAGSVLGQGYLVPPPGFQGAPNTPQMGVPSWNAGQINGQVNGQLNNQISAEANGQANGTSGNGQVNGQVNAPEEGQPGETAGAAVAAPAESLMQWGALHLRARASYQFLYDSGLHVSPGQSADTFTHTLSPGVTIAIGPHVSLDYSPSFRFFSQRDFHNTIDQFASLSAGFGYHDWTFGVSQSFSRSDEPLVETSSQTDQENYSTGLSAIYHFNDKVSLSTSGGVGLTVIGNNSTNIFGAGSTNAPAVLTDSQNYSGSEWLDYRFDEKLSGGLGVTVGYSEQNGGFRALNEEYQGRVSWHPGTKLTVSLSGGMEDEQFLNSGAPDILTPIFSVSAAYQLFEQTTFTLAASRSINASLFQSQVTESSAVGIGLQQRLLGLLQLSLGFGYATSDYKTTTGKFVTARSDEGTSYSVGLNVPFRQRWNLGTFYEYSRNSSSQGGFGYSSSEAGATLSWQY